MPKTKVEIEQDPEKPVEVHVLAESIVSISQSFKRLNRGLSRDAILRLVQSRSGVSMTHVRAVVDGLEELESWAVKRK